MYWTKLSEGALSKSKNIENSISKLVLNGDVCGWRTAAALVMSATLRSTTRKLASDNSEIVLHPVLKFVNTS